MQQHSSRLLLADILALLFAFSAGQLLRLMEFNYSLDVWWVAEGQFRILGLFLIFMGFLLGFGFFHEHYSQRKPFWDELREILSTLLIILVVDAAFFFFNKIYFSRLAFAVQWLLLISLLPTLRTLLKIYSLKRGTWQIPIRMIGSGINAHEAWLALKSEGLMGYQLVEVVLTNDKQPDWVKVPILTWDDGLKPTPEMQVVVKEDEFLI